LLQDWYVQFSLCLGHEQAGATTLSAGQKSRSRTAYSTITLVRLFLLCVRFASSSILSHRLLQCTLHRLSPLFSPPCLPDAQATRFIHLPNPPRLSAQSSGGALYAQSLETVNMTRCTFTRNEVCAWDRNQRKRATTATVVNHDRGLRQHRHVLDSELNRSTEAAQLCRRRFHAFPVVSSCVKRTNRLRFVSGRLRRCDAHQRRSHGAFGLSLIWSAPRT